MAGSSAKDEAHRTYPLAPATPQHDPRLVMTPRGPAASPRAATALGLVLPGGPQASLPYPPPDGIGFGSRSLGPPPDSWSPRHARGAHGTRHWDAGHTAPRRREARLRVQFLDLASVFPAPRLGSVRALTDAPGRQERGLQPAQAAAAAGMEEQASVLAARRVRAARLDALSRLRLSHSVGAHGVSGTTRYESRRAAQELAEARRETEVALAAAATAEERAAAAEAALAELKGESSPIRGNVSDALGDSETARAELARLEGDLARVQAERAKAEAEVVRERGLREAAEAQASEATALAAAVSAPGASASADGDTAAVSRMLGDLRRDLQDARAEAKQAQSDATRLEQEREMALAELSGARGALAAAALATERAEARATRAEARLTAAEAARVLASTSVADAEDKADAAKRATARAERRAEEAEEEADRARKKSKRVLQQLDEAEDTITDLTRQLQIQQRGLAASPQARPEGLIVDAGGHSVALRPGRTAEPDLLRSSSAGMAIEHTQLGRGRVKPPPPARLSDASDRSASVRRRVVHQTSQRRLVQHQRRHSGASTSSRGRERRRSGSRRASGSRPRHEAGGSPEDAPPGLGDEDGLYSMRGGGSVRPGAGSPPRAQGTGGGQAVEPFRSEAPQSTAAVPRGGSASAARGADGTPAAAGPSPTGGGSPAGSNPALSPRGHGPQHSSAHAAAASGAAGGVRFAADTAAETQPYRPAPLRKVSSFRAEPEQTIEFAYDETVDAPSGLVEDGEESVDLVLRVMVWVDPALVVSKRGSAEPLAEYKERVGFRIMALEGARAGSRLGGICKAAPPGPAGDANRRAVLESVLNGLSPGRVWMGKIMAVLVKKKSKARREKLRVKAATRLLKGLKVAPDGANLVGAPGVKLRRVADKSAAEVSVAEPSMEEMAAAATATAAERAARKSGMRIAGAAAATPLSTARYVVGPSGHGSNDTPLQGVTQPAPTRRSRRRSSAPGGAEYLKEMQRAAVAATADGGYDSN